MLQTQDLRISQEKKPYIRVNTRKLNRVLSTKLLVHAILLLAYFKEPYIILKVNIHIV